MPGMIVILYTDQASASPYQYPDIVTGANAWGTPAETK